MLYDRCEEDVPLVDHVVGLTFTYFADPDPNRAPLPATGLGNCVFDPGTPPVPLLAVLAGTAPQPLALWQMSDGPICGVSPNRFDGDLLRIRKVGVTIRVEASSESLRGSGDDFANPGLSSGGSHHVPDYEVSFEATLRNMGNTSKNYQLPDVCAGPHPHPPGCH